MLKSSLKYNILILINVRWWNATAFYALNIARLFQNKGHKVIIGCNKNYPSYTIAKNYGLKVVPLNFYGYNIFELIINFIKLITLIKKESIHVINSHRSEDHTFAMFAKLITGVHFILTRGDRRLISNNFLSRMRYYSSDAVILTCRTIYKQNEKVFLPIKNKVHIIYGSIDEEHFKIIKSRKKTAKKYKINLKKKIIGIAGRLDTVKDQFTFVRAAHLVLQKTKNVVFIIAGKEEHIKIAQLKKIIKDFKIEKSIILLPKIKDIMDVINLFDIGVITSIDSETISRVLLEYMYLQKPVIGTKINVIGEIIKPGVNGELINPGDHVSLSSAFLKLLKKKHLQKKYAMHSYELYQKKYSEEVFYRQYLNVIKKIKT